MHFRTILWWGILGGLCLGCAPEPPLKPDIIALGHAGMGVASTYPMNSFEGITNCLSLGLSGSEMDIQMTRDSVLVLCHDYDLAANTSLTGIIHEYRWQELQERGYFNFYPHTYYKLVSLEQLFSNTANLKNYFFTFDCKLFSKDGSNLDVYYGQYSRALLRTLDAYDMRAHVFIESPHVAFLDLLEAQDSTLLTFLYTADVANGIETILERGYYGLSMSMHDVTAAEVAAAQAQGIVVSVWNAQSAADNREAVEKSPNIIVTDKPSYLHQLLH